MSFLPTDYSAPIASTGGGRYLNPSKIEDGGSVRIRILSDAITGWEYWTGENKPVRSKSQFESLPPDIRVQNGKPDRIKHFWAFIVWNYDTSEVQVCQVSQKTIQEGILALLEDWGEPGKYDIRIKRDGLELKTTYTVTPIPPSEFKNEEAIAEAQKINLDALYSGGDPFAEDATPEPLPMPTEAQHPSPPSVEEAYAKYLAAWEGKPSEEQYDFSLRCADKAKKQGNTELAALIEAHAQESILF